MHDYVNNIISGTSRLQYYKEYQVLIAGIKKEKERERKRRREKKWKMKQKLTCMRSGSRPSPEGTRLLFAGDTVSPIMCPADEQQKNDKKRPDEYSQDEGRDKAEKTRLDRNEVVGFRRI